MLTFIEEIVALDWAIAQHATHFLVQYSAVKAIVAFSAMYLSFGMLIACIYLLRSSQDRRILLLALCSLAIATYLCGELGHLLPRDRPYAAGLIPNLLQHGALHRSWPSSHATGSFAFAGVLLGLLPRRPITWAVVFMAVWIVVTRALSGVHFATDILSGIFLGGCVSYSLVYFYQRHLQNK